MSWFKSLTCKHEYEEISSILIEDYRYYVIIRCNKCGKTKRIYISDRRL